MIRTREATEDDMRFVRASWFESYLKSRPRDADEFDIFRAGMNARIEGALKTAKVVVAYPEAVPDEIVGYAVHDWKHLFYVYVKADYRKRGAGTMLISFGPQVYWTKPAKKWVREWFERKGISPMESEGVRK